MATQHLPQADQADRYSQYVTDTEIGEFDSIYVIDEIDLTKRNPRIQEDKINKHSEDPCPENKDVYECSSGKSLQHGRSSVLQYFAEKRLKSAFPRDLSRPAHQET